MVHFSKTLSSEAQIVMNGKSCKLFSKGFWLWMHIREQSQLPQPFCLYEWWSALSLHGYWWMVIGSALLLFLCTVREDSVPSSFSILRWSLTRGRWCVFRWHQNWAMGYQFCHQDATSLQANHCTFPCLCFPSSSFVCIFRLQVFTAMDIFVQHLTQWGLAVDWVFSRLSHCKCKAKPIAFDIPLSPGSTI